MEPTPVEENATELIDDSVKEIKDECKSCQRKIEHNCSLINTRAFHCRWCDKWEEDDTSDDDCEKKSFYCRFCTRKCWNCKVRGCEECVDVVCCDCSVRMCGDCRNSDILCGCYGSCYTCGRDVNRGSEGWPCNDCEKWYCDSCRYDDNDCQECNPRSEESDETSEGSDSCFATKETSEATKEENEEETPYINVETSEKTSEGSDSCEATKEKVEEISIINVETSEESDSCEATKETLEIEDFSPLL
jgi:hypothetical protein